MKNLIRELTGLGFEIIDDDSHSTLLKFTPSKYARGCIEISVRQKECFIDPKFDYQLELDCESVMGLHSHHETKKIIKLFMRERQKIIGNHLKNDLDLKEIEDDYKLRQKTLETFSNSAQKCKTEGDIDSTRTFKFYDRLYSIARIKFESVEMVLNLLRKKLCKKPVI